MLKHMPPGPASGQNRPPRGLNRSSQPLNISTLSTAGLGPPKIHANGNGPPRMSSILTTTPLTSISSFNKNHNDRLGAREALTSLGLLCLGDIYIN